MTARVPPEHIAVMQRLKDAKPALTLQEIQAKLLEETGTTYAIGTISNRIRRAGEERHQVFLSAEERDALKKQYGSVGAGIKNAVHTAAFQVQLPKDELTRKAYIVLRDAAPETGLVPWQTAVKLLMDGLPNLTVDDAHKVIGHIQKAGFLRRASATELKVLRAKALEVTPEIAIAQVFGGA